MANATGGDCLAYLFSNRIGELWDCYLLRFVIYAVRTGFDFVALLVARNKNAGIASE